MYQVTNIRPQDPIYLLNSKAMRPKGKAIILFNVLFQKIFDKSLQSNLLNKTAWWVQQSGF